MAGLFDKTVIARIGEDEEKLLVTLDIDGTTIANDTYLLTFNAAGQSNVQLDRTFGGKLLVTAFGEQLSQGTFSGFTAPSDCSGSVASNSSDLGAVYRRYRAGTNKSKTPVLKMAFGSSVYRGIILGMMVQPWDQNNRILLYNITAMGSIL